MYRRKLLSLNYPHPDSFNVSDNNDFRSLVVWLEDQKIRHYKIEHRAALKNISSPDWLKAFEYYMVELACPYTLTDHESVIDWALGYAVRLEYGDEAEKFKSVAPHTLGTPSSTPAETSKSTNPLDNLNFDDPDFKAGVASLAMLLQVPPHHDHLEQLKAICLIVNDKLSKEAIERSSKKSDNKNETIPLAQTELGFETGDYIINEAAKILRLIYLKDLRELQSQINQAIVTIQTITANPKTDSRLGKIGRS